MTPEQASGPATISMAEILPHFPQARIAVCVVEGLRLRPERTPELDAFIGEVEARARARWRNPDGAPMELAQIPGIAAWRSAYKAFGIKRTSYRSSVERLVKRVLAGDSLPRINDGVDLYNAISLDHVLCCGADDLDALVTPLAFRFSRPDDSFFDMGAAPGEDPYDPPKPGEVVYADARHVLCRRWNWRQDSRSGLTTDTRRAVITLQSNGWGDVEAAVADMARWWQVLGATSFRHVILETANPEAPLPLS
jgi:DNA/RNA-binding domain of Phe-tRNA-synthetase-like protein